MNETNDVNIEEIMQEIRQQILQQRRVGKPPLPVKGDRLSPQFYEQLYQATLLQGEVGVKIQVSPSGVPLIGPIIDKLREKIHELVLFYVNQSVSQQAAINDHILQLITLLSQEMEEDVTESDAGR